jgi:hypothetical protein
MGERRQDHRRRRTRDVNTTLPLRKIAGKQALKTATNTFAVQGSLDATASASTGYS